MHNSDIQTCEFESARKELTAAFSEQRESLWKVIYFRLDHRLSGRIDPDDVLQEAWLDANQRLSRFVTEGNSWTMDVWIRVILRQTLINVHRRHFSSKKRDAAREQPAVSTLQKNGSTLPTLAETFAARTSSPSQAAMKKESAVQLELVLETLRCNDQVVLKLRHFEDLTNKEVADELGITEKAASIRHARAIERLRSAMRNDTELPRQSDEIAARLADLSQPILAAKT